MMLYELTGEVLELYQMMQDGDIEEVAFKNTLEAVEGEIEYKCESYCKIIKSLNGDSESLQKEIDRLKARQKSIKNNVERLRTAMQTMLEVTGKDKIKTNLFTISLRNKPPELKVTGDVPKEFFIQQEPKIDNAGIKDLLKTQELEFAHLEQTQSLSIR